MNNNKQNNKPPKSKRKKSNNSCFMSFDLLKKDAARILTALNLPL